MRLKFFKIPVEGFDAEEAEVNRFLAGVRPLTVDRQLVADGQRSFWVLCVEYLDSAKARASQAASRVDYKEVLSAEDFPGVRQARFHGGFQKEGCKGRVRGSNRVLRGGSWNNNADNERVANRNNNNPDNRNNNIGFRLALAQKRGGCPAIEQDAIPSPEVGGKQSAGGFRRNAGRLVPEGNVVRRVFFCCAQKRGRVEAGWARPTVSTGRATTRTTGGRCNCPWVPARGQSRRGHRNAPPRGSSVRSPLGTRLVTDS